MEAPKTDMKPPRFKVPSGLIQIHSGHGAIRGPGRAPQTVNRGYFLGSWTKRRLTFFLLTLCLERFYKRISLQNLGAPQSHIITNTVLLVKGWVVETRQLRVFSSLVQGLGEYWSWRNNIYSDHCLYQQLSYNSSLCTMNCSKNFARIHSFKPPNDRTK